MCKYLEDISLIHIKFYRKDRMGPKVVIDIRTSICIMLLCFCHGLTYRTLEDVSGVPHGHCHTIFTLKCQSVCAVYGHTIYYDRTLQGLKQEGQLLKG